MSNPIAKYAREAEIGTTELASRLGISKGSASELISGKRGIGKKTAKRMAKLTGLPWHFFMSGDAP
jgi:plasmid maintenance system antidote protein VapI